MMFQRLVFTLATAISLTGLYALYTLAMRPIVVIPIAPDQSVENPVRTEVELPSETKRVAETYLPRKKWAWNSQHALRVDQAYIYTDDWKPDEENNKRIHFSPFALAWLVTGEDGKETAYTVSSDSAQLEFASAIDLKSASSTPGRVVRARLNGDVSISGPNGLDIKGRTFSFDEETLMLQTYNPVQFRFQSNVGKASRMEMKLLAGEGKPTLDRPHVSGIESIRLIAAPNGSSPEMHEVSLKVHLPPDLKQYSPVDIRCASDLLYSFKTHTAVLSKDVRVWNSKKSSDPNKKDRSDNWLKNCDTLTIQLQPKKATHFVEPAFVDSDLTEMPPPYQKPELDLEFSSFSAEGPQLTVNSTSQGVRATMNRLCYVAGTRIVSLISKNAQEDVEVRRSDTSEMELYSPSIEARLSEKNELEELVCRGAGKLNYYDDRTTPRRMTVQAYWEKSLRKSFDTTTQLDLIELDEKAQFVQYGQKFGVGAEQIKIWLKPIKINVSATNADQNSPQPATPDPEPKRMVASGDVALQHPQMKLHTHELDVVFDEPIRQSSAQWNRKSRERLQPAGYTAKHDNPAVRKAPQHAVPLATGTQRSRPRQAFANVPVEPDGLLGPSIEIPFESPTAQPKSAGRGAKPQVEEPWIVKADRLEGRVRLISGTQKFEHLAVRCLGKEVDIARKGKPNEKPLKINGEQIDLEAESEQKVVVHVLGRPGCPARITERFAIEGRDIHLDRAANRAWVAGAGILRLPLPADAKIPGLEANTASELQVKWKESMDFNGQNAQFFGTIEAKLGFAKMHCEQMLAQLTERLSFQEAQPDSTPALNLIRCRDKVWFEHATYAQNKQMDVFRGDVGEFTWKHAAGVVEATGPGNVFAWRRKQNTGGSASRETIQANRPIPTQVTTWDYTHVKFEGKLNGTFSGLNPGESNRQSVAIEERVEVTYGPVESPNERVDPDQLPSMAGNLHCNRLEVLNREGADRSSTKNLELVGRGNAEVEGQVDGRKFTASADEIIYDGAKGFYILRARGRQNARVTGIGDGRQGGQGQEIHFNPDPKHLILRIDRAASGSFSQ